MMRLRVVAFLIAGLAAMAEVRAQEGAPAEAVESRPTAVEATLGASMLSRKLVYHEDINDSLAGYALPAGPMASLDLRWYPAAHFTSGLASAFGVDVRYDRSFGIESRDRGASFRNVARLVEVSLLGRFRRPRYELVFGLGYGNHAFVFESRTPTTNLVPGYSRIPGVEYAYLRLSAEARLSPFERVGFVVGAAYLAAFDLGGIGSSAFFPHATGGGTEFRAHVFVPLPRRFELRGGLGYRRYFLDMHSELGDPQVAGGAVDHHVTLDLGASYRF